MPASPKKPGRPRTTERERSGEYVGFRSPKDLKEKLEEAAKKSGRSLSTEAQVRLELSFERQTWMFDALELLYGRELTGLLLGLGEVMKDTGEWAAFVLTGKPRTPWMSDPSAYARARAAAISFIDALAPTGSECDWSTIATPGQPELAESLRRGAVPGASRVKGYLAELRRPAFEDGDRGKLDRMDRIRELLAPLLDRARGAEGNDG